MVYTVVMHVEAVPNRGSHPTILLRQSYREGQRVRKRTLANLTHLPPEIIEIIKPALRGQKLLPAEQAFAIERSKPHGHVKAILGTIRKLGLDTIIAAKRSRQRDLVLAMIAERLLHGCSKLAGTRLWHATTLAEELSVADADVDELYKAMDWLLERQPRIEKKLAARHLAEGAQVFYDITSSYYEGRTSEPKKSLSAADTVRSYKNLGQVEQGFRCLKGIDIRVRPIRHREDPRVRAHVFLCLLAYYVEWHLRRALGSLLFDDEELAANRKRRDPVAQAKPSRSARRKKVWRGTPAGLPVHSFDTLLEELGSLCRNRCRLQVDPSGSTFTQDTRPTELQCRVFHLLGL